jgi:hypothetical protein
MGFNAFERYLRMLFELKPLVFQLAAFQPLYCFSMHIAMNVARAEKLVAIIVREYLFAFVI